MCKSMEEMCEWARNEGREEGREEGMWKVAGRLLRDGLTLEKIAEYTGLSLDDLQKLQPA